MAGQVHRMGSSIAGIDDQHVEEEHGGMVQKKVRSLSEQKEERREKREERENHDQDERRGRAQREARRKRQA